MKTFKVSLDQKTGRFIGIVLNTVIIMRVVQADGEEGVTHMCNLMIRRIIIPPWSDPASSPTDWVVNKFGYCQLSGVLLLQDP